MLLCRTNRCLAYSCATASKPIVLSYVPRRAVSRSAIVLLMLLPGLVVILSEGRQPVVEGSSLRLSRLVRPFDKLRVTKRFYPWKMLRRAQHDMFCHPERRASARSRRIFLRLSRLVRPFDRLRVTKRFYPLEDASTGSA